MFVPEIFLQCQAPQWERFIKHGCGAKQHDEGANDVGNIHHIYLSSLRSMSTITLQVHRSWQDMKLAESIAQAWKLPSHKSSPCLWIQLLYKRSNSLLLWEKGCNSLKYIPHCLYGHICLCQISTKPFKKWCFTQISIQVLGVKNHTMLNVSFNESVSPLKGN